MSNTLCLSALDVAVMVVCAFAGNIALNWIWDRFGNDPSSPLYVWRQAVKRQGKDKSE